MATAHCSEMLKMATAETGKKICIVCGKDVAGQPRVKDERGRYMCAGECQAKAKAAAEAKAKAAPQAPVAAKSAPAAPPKAAKADAGSLLGNLIDDSPMMKAANCESCGNPMPGGAKICTRCGFNTETGKALKTAVIVEKKDKNEPKAPKVKGGNKYAVGEFGPSFGVLFLITAGVLTAVACLSFVNPLFLIVALGLAGIVNFVAHVWGIVKAFQNEETGWGVCGILSFVIPLVGLAFLYYMIFPNEDKWSKALYCGSLIALLACFALIVGVVGIDEFQAGMQSQ